MNAKITFRLEELSKIVQGEVFGDPNLIISGVEGLKEAKKGDLSLCYLASYEKIAQKSQASAFLTDKNFAHQFSAGIIVANPRLALCKILELYIPKTHPLDSELKFISKKAKVASSAVIYPFVTIADDAEIGEEVILYPGVFVGEGAKIGKNSVLYPNVVIYRDCVVGQGVIIHANSTIGADGFGFVLEKGEAIKIPHIKKVILGDAIEIGANSTVDRGSMQDTIVGKGTKIDNLVQVAHNVQVGENNLLFSQSAIAGSSVTGKRVMILGKAGVADGLEIPDDLVLGPASVLSRKPKTPGGVYYGYPARKKEEWVESTVSFNQLPNLFKKVKALEKKLEELTEKIKP